jgi:uncharacterized protein (DUF2235 family)
MFRLKKYDEPQLFMSNRFIPDEKAEPQDILQVWFAGAHGATGGGYPEVQSALSKYPLLWMLEEATKFGLTVNIQMVKQLAWGVHRKGSPFTYVKPDVAGEMHDPMTWGWRLLEYLPKKATYKEWPERKSHFGSYIPDGEPRLIPEDAVIHESVVKRMDAVKDYRPINLPKQYKTFPMPEAPSEQAPPEAA